HIDSVAPSRFRNYVALAKPRLASLVVFSSVLGYILATGVAGLQWSSLLALIVGGFLVTGGSNGLNQVIERETDKLMSRTKDRPLAAERMSVTEATVFSTFISIIGLALIWRFTNFNAFILAVASLVSYAFMYTPLKHKTSWAVLVGAFPGAVPPMLGWVAATGEFGLVPGALFAIQFIIGQVPPRFGSIAWVLDEDYRKAGYSYFGIGWRENQRSASWCFYILCSVIRCMSKLALGAWYYRLTLCCDGCGRCSSFFCRLYGPLVYKEQDVRSAQGN
ncbi:UNVERIFIED_CONTAM: hypothetical protein GTU68_065162, partial [Idotea baltica]|nr:hypothetical protein [Idotea baltica]